MKKENLYLIHGEDYLRHIEEKLELLWMATILMHYIKNGAEKDGYLRMTGIPYSSVYGEIVEENGRLTTTGAKRTGCMFCMFGVHLEKEPNRFQRMALTHPKPYDFCIHKLGCGKVLDFLGVPYAPNGGEFP